MTTDCHGRIEGGLLRVLGTHQGGDPVPQVRDLVGVLVRGGVAGQLPQLLGGVAGAARAGEVHGRVSDGGSLERVTGDHRQAGQLGQADCLGDGAGLPGRCRRELVGGRAGVAARQYRQVAQGVPGDLGMARGSDPARPA